MTSSTDGPDQGDPAAWLQPAMGIATTDPQDAEVWRRAGGEVVPLYLRAPGAVAAAPPGDEDGASADLSEDDLDRIEAEWWGKGPHPLVAEVRRRRRDAAAPPAGHEDEAAR